MREKLEVGPPSAIVSHLNFLIYGEAGAGKTWLASTAQDHADTSPVLFLDVEGGTTTIRKRKDVDVKRVTSYEDMVEVHSMLYKENDGYYKTVIIDSLSELQKFDMGAIMKELANRRPDLDPDVPGMREWGKSSTRMRKIVRGFRDLPMHTIMTCLVDIDRDENNVLMFRPQLPGKLKVDIAGFMDIVGYLSSTVENDERIRKIQFAATRRVTAKDRTSSLGDVVHNPTIPELWKQIQES